MSGTLETVYCLFIETLKAKALYLTEKMNCVNKLLISFTSYLVADVPFLVVQIARNDHPDPSNVQETVEATVALAKLRRRGENEFNDFIKEHFPFIDLKSLQKISK